MQQEVHARRDAQHRDTHMQIVPQEAVQPEHFVLSHAGVTHIKPAPQAPEATMSRHANQPQYDTEFTPLPQWVHEMAAFNALRQLRLFRLYLPRKSFTIWRGAARAVAKARAAEALRARAFCANPHSHSVVSDVMRLLHDTCSTSLMPFEAPEQVHKRDTKLSGVSALLCLNSACTSGLSLMTAASLPPVPGTCV